MIFVYLSAAFLLVFIYPFLIYPLILSTLRKQEIFDARCAARSDRKVAMLFCAYNEEKSLPAKIRNIRDIKRIIPDIEVRVYTDCCTDSTNEILRQANDLLVVHEGSSRIGKAAGMRILAESTHADLLIFTDATVILDPQSVSRLISYFENPSIGTVAGTLHYTDALASQTAHTGSLYWKLEETIKRLESETGSTMGASGQLFATRKSLYPTVPPHLLDDMIASISPLFMGYRVVSANDVHAFQRSTADSGDEFRRKRRIACRAFNTHRYLRPKLRTMSSLDRFKYNSHKLLRWFSPAFLTLWFVCTMAAVVTLAGWIPALVCAIAAASLVVLSRAFRIPVVSNVSEMLASIFATGIGVLEAIAGRDYKTWTPAKSRRQ
jgi:cellulose synthase/poly-beta-1,6-N-acetylglucosamine synthase-like glycosyltransferase